MSRVRSILRRLQSIILTLAIWAITAAAALAAAGPGPQAESKGGGDYTFGYFILMLGIGLGLLVVIRSSNRRERAKPEGYVAKSYVKEED